MVSLRPIPRYVACFVTSTSPPAPTAEILRPRSVLEQDQGLDFSEPCAILSPREGTGPRSRKAQWPHRLARLGHQPFKLATRVRIPLGLPHKESA